MALQTGVSASKVLVLVGAGLTGSVVLRSGKLSELLVQLQEVMKGVNEAEISPGRYDAALLAAQIRNLAQEIRELSVSNPITIFNGNSNSGGYSSYILPAAALGAMGYCYMWWKGVSFSDVMYVTKHNMANAVTTVSKQLDNVTEALAATKRHLSKRLENLDWKIEEQIDMSKLISHDVNDVKLNLNQIGCDIDLIHQMVSGLEGKIELLESKQDVTNSGLYYLCQVAQGVENGENAKAIQDIGVKLIDQPTLTRKESLPKNEGVQGLQFITESKPEKVSNIEVKKSGLFDITDDFSTKMRIHRSYPVGPSFTRSVIGLKS